MGDAISELTELTSAADNDRIAIVDVTATETKYIQKSNLVTANDPISFIVALSDETTVLPTASTTVPLLKFRLPFAFTITEVRASVNIAGTGGALVTVDIHENGTTILSTKITIDATERTSETAATPPTVSDSSLADDAEIEVFLDVRDTDNVATGLKVTLVGNVT